jgi:acetyl esterase
MFADVAYGPHERNRIDLYLARSEQPTPVVFMIHGGGFRNGDKSRWASDKQMSQLLASGVSCVAVNYPFLDAMPIQDILRQCARAVQFVRSKVRRVEARQNPLRLHGRLRRCGHLALAGHAR